MTEQCYPFRHVYTGIEKQWNVLFHWKLLSGSRTLTCNWYPVWNSQGTCSSSLSIPVECHSLTWRTWKEGFEQRSSDLSQKKDWAAAFHQMGKMYARNREQIWYERHLLPASDHQEARRERTWSVPEHDVSCQSEAESHRKDGKPATAFDYVFKPLCYNWPYTYVRYRPEFHGWHRKEC